MKWSTGKHITHTMYNWMGFNNWHSWNDWSMDQFGDWCRMDNMPIKCKFHLNFSISKTITKVSFYQTKRQQQQLKNHSKLQYIVERINIDKAPSINTACCISFVFLSFDVFRFESVVRTKYIMEYFWIICLRWWVANSNWSSMKGVSNSNWMGNHCWTMWKNHSWCCIGDGQNTSNCELKPQKCIPKTKPNKWKMVDAHKHYTQILTNLNILSWVFFFFC